VPGLAESVHLDDPLDTDVEVIGPFQHRGDRRVPLWESGDVGDGTEHIIGRYVEDAGGGDATGHGVVHSD
jgi:hypothetical protein